MHGGLGPKPEGQRIVVPDHLRHSPSGDRASASWADLAHARVCFLLRSAGIDSLVLKGITLSRWLYEDPDERGVGDVDVLVPPSQFSSASGVLEGSGYRRLDRGMSALE